MKNVPIFQSNPLDRSYHAMKISHLHKINFGKNNKRSCRVTKEEKLFHTLYFSKSKDRDRVEQGPTAKTLYLVQILYLLNRKENPAVYS